jgi:NAD-reducing hydrogenase large subunit
MSKIELQNDKKVVIEHMSKLEGHGKITVYLNDNGDVDDAHFHVTEFRGFEKFLEGRMAAEAALITPRICGICPVSHHLAAAKAIDMAFGVEIPPAAKKLRELMHMGQMIHSHALHFYFLCAPDFILGVDSDPAKRSAFGLVEQDPELAMKAIKLRKIGQDIVDVVGGRQIHPVTAIPGGMSKALTKAEKYTLLEDLKKSIDLGKLSVSIIKDLTNKYADVIPKFGDFETHYMALDNDGSLELYDGKIKLVDSKGKLLERINDYDYKDIIGEEVHEYSYLKSGFYRKQGFKDGIYRVGPLARVNMCDRIGTPLADEALKEYKQIVGDGYVHNTFYFHYTRIIELLHSIEKAILLLEDEDITSPDHRVVAKRQAGRGVGVIEAPRGTLIHEYVVDDFGKIEKANLVVATTNNNAAMDYNVKESAKQIIKAGNITEGNLNLLEMAIRAYDPCLSCATHAIGQMPLKVDIMSADNKLIDTIVKE